MRTTRMTKWLHHQCSSDPSSVRLVACYVFGKGLSHMVQGPTNLSLTACYGMVRYSNGWRVAGIGWYKRPPGQNLVDHRQWKTLQRRVWGYRYWLGCLSWFFCSELAFVSLKKAHGANTTWLNLRESSLYQHQTGMTSIVSVFIRLTL